MDSIINQLCSDFQHIVGNRNIENSIYIQPNCNILRAYKPKQCTSNDFLNTFYTILQHNSSDSCQCYVILGDKCVGKTCLAIELCNYLWTIRDKNKEKNGNFIPIYFDNYLDYATQLQNLEKISKHERCLILFDGYNEMEIEKFSKATAGKDGIYIYLLRTGQFLTDKRIQLFGNERKEIFLENFTDVDIDNYLKATTEKNPLQFSNVDVEYFLPNLKEIGQNPLMLRSIVQNLANVVQRELHLKPWEIQGEIYKLATDSWFQHHFDKFKAFEQKSRNQLLLTPEKFVFYCRANAINWAKMLITNDLKSFQESEGDTSFLEPIQSSKFVSENWSTDRENIFLKSNNYLKAIQNSFPGQFDAKKIKFLENSLMEYFADSSRFSGIVGEFQFYYLRHFKKTKEPASMLELDLTQDLDKLKCFANEVANDTRFEQLLFEIIFASKSDSSLRKMASNSITILNLAGISLSGQDFRFIQIPGANLCFSLNGNTDFRGADLTKVSFNESWLNLTRFEGANVEDIKLGIRRSFVYRELWQPLFIDFWKQCDDNLFLFVQYEDLRRNRIKILKVDLQGKIVSTFRMKRNRGANVNKLQIFDNKLAIITRPKIKVFDLVTDKKIATFGVNAFADSDDVNTVNIKLENEFHRELYENKYAIRRKFNQSGKFLVSVSGYLEIRIYRVDFIAFKVNLSRRFDCKEGVVAFDFHESNENCLCVFLFTTGLAIVNLTIPSSPIQIINSTYNEFLVSILESVLLPMGIHEPFSINPLTKDESIIEIAMLEGYHNIVIAQLDGTKITQKHKLCFRDSLVRLDDFLLTNLFFKGTILVCVTISPHNNKTSRILVYSSLNDYKLIYRETFHMEINQVSIVQLCNGIYELAILSSSFSISNIVKTIEIQCPEALDPREIEINATFAKRFTESNVFYDTDSIKFSPDLTKLIMLTKPVDTSLEWGESVFEPRFVEIWDLNRGRRTGSVQVSNIPLLLDWLRDDMFILIRLFGEASLYNANGHQLRDWTQLPYSKKLKHFHKVKGIDDIFINDSVFGEIILIKFIVSDTEFTFKKISSLIDTTSYTSPYYYSTFNRKFSRDSPTQVKIYNLFAEPNENIVHEATFTGLINIEYDRQLQVVYVFTANALYFLRASQSQGLTITRTIQFHHPSYFTPNISLHEPQNSLIAHALKDSVNIWRYYNNGNVIVQRPWKIPMWFSIDQIHALKIKNSDPSKIRLVLISDSVRDMVCIEFCAREEFTWKLVWGKLSFTDFRIDNALFKNAIKLCDSTDRIIKVHGASGIKSIPREMYVARADILFPIPGTVHLENISKFTNRCSPECLKFNKFNWIISAVVVKTPSSGVQRREHLALICEGSVNCRRFTFKAELYKKGHYPFVNIKIYKTIREIDEFIRDETVKSKWVYFQKNITKEQGDILIDSILLDRKTKYKTLSENCVKWVTDKLGVIGFEFEQRRRDCFATRATTVKRLKEI